jgi:hypothetical protein
MRKGIKWTMGALGGVILLIGVALAYVHRAELGDGFKSFVCKKLNGDDEKCSGADFLRRQ